MRMCQAHPHFLLLNKECWMNQKISTLNAFSTSFLSMKRIKLFVLTIFCFVATTTFAQQAKGDIVPKLFINGYFFKEKPELPDGKLSITPLKDHEGNRIIALTLEDAELPENVVKEAIPIEQVRNAQEIIEKYETFRDMQQLTFIPQENHVSAPNTPKVNEPFPKFKATDIDGKTWDNAEVKGKAMVINLWYSGCGPCLAEMPELSTWKEKFPDVLFFSATFHDAATTRKITDQHHFTWTHLANAKEMMSWIDGKGFPLTIVVDKAGIVRHLVHGTSVKKRQDLLECICLIVDELTN